MLIPIISKWISKLQGSPVGSGRLIVHRPNVFPYRGLSVGWYFIQYQFCVSSTFLCVGWFLGLVQSVSFQLQQLFFARFFFYLHLTKLDRRFVYRCSWLTLVVSVWTDLSKDWNKSSFQNIQRCSEYWTVDKVQKASNLNCMPFSEPFWINMLVASHCNRMRKQVGVDLYWWCTKFKSHSVTSYPDRNVWWPIPVSFSIF
jgi:hypothetical protein